MILLIKPTALSKITVLHGCFLSFLNCANGTKSRKTSHIYPNSRKCKILKGNRWPVFKEHVYSRTIRSKILAVIASLVKSKIMLITFRLKDKNRVHLRGHSKKTSPGGGEGACQNWWQKVTNGERVTQYSDVSHSVFMLIIYFISSYLQIITPSIPCTTFSYVNEY